MTVERMDGYKADIEAGQRVVAMHPIQSEDIPDREEIARCAAQQSEQQKATDRTSAKYAYGTFLLTIQSRKAGALEQALTILLERLASGRGKGKYYQEFPFSSLLIVDCGMDDDRAPKIAVYLRAAAHKGWSLEVLSKDLETNWRLRPSAEEAQAFLAERGKIKRRSKRGGNEKQETKRSNGSEATTEKQSPKSASNQSNPASLEIEDGDHGRAKAGNGRSGKHPASEKASPTTRTMPISLPSKLPPTSRVFLEFRKETDGSLVQVKWHSAIDVRRSTNQGLGKPSSKGDRDKRSLESMRELGARLKFLTTSKC